MKEAIVDLVKDYQALVGECAWHSLTVDPTLKKVSDDHYTHIVNSLQHYGRLVHGQKLRILEVASYAHTTGYRLQEEQGCDVTLFEISAKALELGRRMAKADGIAAQPRLVAGDFHVLPFEANSFDVVYICSAIHHTWKYDVVISELQRVLAPGGLLLVLNEPCHRQCCFYGFRTNRPTGFTKFESILNDLGILRTFAEPYLGSRPETLFGMIENQAMPLQHLLELFNSTTRIVDLVLTPETCLGELERSWIENRHLDSESLANIIERDLVERRVEALQHFDEMAKGMQFNLPELSQLQPLAQEVARALCKLPPESDGRQFRIGLSEIFGAAVQLVAEKPAGQVHRPEKDLREAFEEKDGIIYAFDSRIRRLLLHDSSVVPDIQIASEKEIAQFFPPDCWQYCARIADEGSRIVTLALVAQSGRIIIPGGQRPLLIVLRYSCVVPEHRHVRIRIRQLERELYLQKLWQFESLLWVAVLPSTSDPTVLDVVREVVAPNGESELNSEGFEVAFAGAFQIE